MNQLLVISGKKITSSHDNRVLFQPDKAGVELDHWVENTFLTKVLRKEERHDLLLNIVYVSELKTPKYGLISIPAAKKLLETDPNNAEIVAFLSSLQAKLSIQFEYGIRDGRVVSISEIKPEEHGLRCKCVCPGCGAPLIANLGRIKQRYFSHKGEACDIAAAQQTALHMLAKEIIEDSKKLLFPGVFIEKDDYTDDIEDYRVQTRIPQTIEYRKAAIVKCDSVSLEKRISNIVPDIMVTAKGRGCLIEVAVTHFVDEEKEQKIKKIGLPLFEIDLSDLYNSEFSRKELAEAVLYNPSNRTWIFNPLYDDAKRWAKEQFSKYIHSAEEEIERQDEKEAIKAEKKQQRREIGEKRIKEIFEPDNYQKTVAALANEEEVAKQIKLLHMKTDIDKLPFFLNIPITGEMVFPCDRRIWQSALFDKFVFNRNSEDENKPSVHIKRVQKWIEKYNKQFPIDWTLTYKTVVSVSRGEKKTISLLYDVVVTFFNYLVYLGFLEPFVFQEAVVRQSHSLEPPNREHAEILYDAINKVDWYDPAVDDRIMEFLTPIGSASNYYLPRNRTMLLNEIENQETIVPKTKWEDRKKEIENDRVTGLADVQGKDFDGNEPIYDKFNWRWLKCTNCEKLFRADQMASYGGRGNINKGICRKCSNDRRG